jgi:hypothetical protein
MVPENKTIDKQIKFIGLQNNRHPSQHTVGKVHKASGTCAFHDAVQAEKQKEVHPPYSPDLAPLGARSGEYVGLLSVSPPEEQHKRRKFCRRGDNPRMCDSGSAIDS